MVETAVLHVAGECHVVVDCVVDGFDAVGVVLGEYGVVRGLDVFVYNAVDNAEGIEVEVFALLGAVCDGLGCVS